MIKLSTEPLIPAFSNLYNKIFLSIVSNALDTSKNKPVTILVSFSDLLMKGPVAITMKLLKT